MVETHNLMKILQPLNHYAANISIYMYLSLLTITLRLLEVVGFDLLFEVHFS